MIRLTRFAQRRLVAVSAGGPSSRPPPACGVGDALSARPPPRSSWPSLAVAELRHGFSSAASASSPAADRRDRSSRRMMAYLVGLAAAMVGASYAAVPLYRRFCQVTGYGGTVQRRESVEEKIARHSQAGTTTSREIVVQFNADVDDALPWKFVPTQREVLNKALLSFWRCLGHKMSLYSSTPITGVSSYNVTPMKAAVYFNKIQCFCFEDQTLLPGEKIDMPVFFYIDPEFETDPKMDGINNIILSYTFFKDKIKN